MVEFNGISDAPRQVAMGPRTRDRSATCDGASLEQGDPAVPEGELDVVLGGAEDVVAVQRQRVQCGELLVAKAGHLDET
jgi:hypothetical protein